MSSMGRISWAFLIKKKNLMKDLLLRFFDLRGGKRKRGGDVPEFQATVTKYGHKNHRVPFSSHKSSKCTDSFEDLYLD